LRKGVGRRRERGVSFERSSGERGEVRRKKMISATMPQCFGNSKITLIHCHR
jgi:hypothetical protein